MIITRTPFRISFGGGGSDLPSFYREEPGMVISAAIAKYMYLVVKESFGNTFRVSYSQTELRDRAGEIEHPIVRECLAALGIDRGLEIVSIADSAGADGHGLVEQFHGRAARSAVSAERAQRRCGQAGAPRLRDRDQAAGRADRQAGPVHRGLRRAAVHPVPAGRRVCMSIR